MRSENVNKKQHRDKFVREQQRELVLKYRAKSYSFREIAEAVSSETGVNISYQTAFNDYMEALEEAKKQVEDTALYSLVSQLEKLDRLEHEYWRAWEVSLGNVKSKKMKKRGKANDNAQMEMEESDNQQTGEVAYLNGIKSCIELRCKMMGYITSNLDIKSNGKELGAITGMIVK